MKKIYYFYTIYESSLEYNGCYRGEIGRHADANVPLGTVYLNMLSRGATGIHILYPANPACNNCREYICVSIQNQSDND